MPLYLTERQQRIWQFSKKASEAENIKVALTKMVIFRQGQIDSSDQLEMFTQALVGLDMRAFQVAMAVLSELPRMQGETAFPSLGDILSVMGEASETYVMYSEGKKELDTKPVFEKSSKRLSA
jgi:hypothetical protein